MVSPQNGILLGQKKECHDVDETSKQQAKRKKPDTNGRMLYDPTYRKCPEWANLQRRKADGGRQGPGGREEWGEATEGKGPFEG